MGSIASMEVWNEQNLGQIGCQPANEIEGERRTVMIYHLLTEVNPEVSFAYEALGDKLVLSWN